VTVALFLLSVYAMLRGLRSDAPPAWTVLAVVSLGAALLGVEIVLPLAVAVSPALWAHSRHWMRLGPSSAGRAGRLVFFVAGPEIVTALVVLYKASAAEDTIVPSATYLAWVALGALMVNFGTFGLALPHTTAWSLRQLSWVHYGVGALLVIAVCVYVSTLPKTDSEIRPRRAWTRQAAVGVAIFVFGVAIFFVAPRVGFWSLGLTNRVWIAASIGVAMVLVAISGWVSSWLTQTHARYAFAALTAGLCSSGFVVNSAVSEFWIEAGRREIAALEDVRRALPTMKPATTLMLKGVCPYVGPATVFESSWDLAGALQLLYEDATLRADVTSAHVEIDTRGLRTQLYGKSYFYPYGDRLLLFDRTTGAVVRLTSAEIARMHVSSHDNCPDGAPGGGAVLLPFDGLYARWVHSRP
jgi:hypothetical protein